MSTRRTTVATSLTGVAANTAGPSADQYGRTPPASLSNPADRDTDAVYAVHNPGTPGATLLNLMGTSPTLDRAIAAHPNTPVSALNQLTRSAIEADNADLLTALAGNPNTSPQTLARLSGSVWSNVRFTVAGNPSTDATVLSALIIDPDPGIAAHADSTRRQHLLDYISGLPAHDRQRAHLLLDEGFPGHVHDLHTVLFN